MDADQAVTFVLAFKNSAAIFCFLGMGWGEGDANWELTILQEPAELQVFDAGWQEIDLFHQPQ